MKPEAKHKLTNLKMKLLLQEIISSERAISIRALEACGHLPRQERQWN